MDKGKYSDLLANKKKNGEAKAITVQFLKMATKGEVLVGKLLSASPVRGTSSNKVYYNYMIETDTGLVKIAFGGAYDAEMAKLIFIGGVYAWTYQGEEKISNGHTMRRYDTVEVDLSDAIETADENAAKALAVKEV